MAKAICIIRTSTDRQEIESQRKEVVDMALADGYAMDDVIVIGKQGASAIKLDDAYLENLKLFYETAEREDVGCVYAWAIDRIGRNEEVLMRFKNFLIDRKIQLHIKTPSLTLLDDDGTVNSGLELAFTLFATLSKQEMLNKKERFRRARQRNKEQGRYNGGRILFGYRINEDGYYEIDDETATVVRTLYNEYVSTPESTIYLARKYRDVLGTKPDAPLNVRRVFLTRILRNPIYFGGGKYPAIVDKDTFDKVQVKLSEYRKLPRIAYERVPYFLHGLLCTYVVKPDGTSSRYILTPQKAKNIYWERNTKYSISVNVADSLAVMLLHKHLDAIRPDLEKQLERSLKMLQTDLSDFERDIENAEKRYRELDERYFGEGLINRKSYERLSAKLKAKIAELQSHRAEKYQEIEILKENARAADGTLWIDEYGQRDMCLNLIDEVAISRTKDGVVVLSFRFKGVLNGVVESGVYERRGKLWNGEPIQIIRHVRAIQEPRPPRERKNPDK